MMMVCFTVKFYKFFLELLGQEFLDSIDASFDDRELCRGVGVIALIPKEYANVKDLVN